MFALLVGKPTRTNTNTARQPVDLGMIVDNYSRSMMTMLDKRARCDPGRVPSAVVENHMHLMPAWRNTLVDAGVLEAEQQLSRAGARGVVRGIMDKQKARLIRIYDDGLELRFPGPTHGAGRHSVGTALARVGTALAQRWHSLAQRWHSVGTALSCVGTRWHRWFEERGE